MSKKVLFFVSTTLIGGAESNVLKISRELSEKGYEVHLATLENNGPMFDVCEHMTSLTTIGLFYKTPLRSVYKFWSLLKKHHIEVVLNFGMRVEFFSRILSKLYSKKIWIISNIRSTDTFRKKYHVIFDQLTFGLVDCWISNSIAGKNAFIKREKIPEEKIDVIYNYIEVPEGIENTFRDKKKPIRNKIIRIGILANIRKLKGYYDLDKVARNIISKGFEPKFICGGVDHTNGRFEDFIREQKLNDHFVLKGYVKDKNAFFEGIDVFLLPSYMEGMPTVILEAMVYGKPIVSTNIDGIPEQISHGVNGFLYAPGDTDGFAEGIIKLFTEHDLAEAFVKNSYQIANTVFDKKNNLNKWIAVINNR